MKTELLPCPEELLARAADLAAETNLPPQLVLAMLMHPEPRLPAAAPIFLEPAQHKSLRPRRPR